MIEYGIFLESIAVLVLGYLLWWLFDRKNLSFLITSMKVGACCAFSPPSYSATRKVVFHGAGFTYGVLEHHVSFFLQPLTNIFLRSMGPCMFEGNMAASPLPRCYSWQVCGNFV